MLESFLSLAFVDRTNLFCSCALTMLCSLQGYKWLVAHLDLSGIGKTRSCSDSGR